MKVVWANAPFPLEYSAKRFSLAYILRAITPIVVLILSLLFVVMSFYIAPTSVDVPSQPIISIPTFYLAAGTVFKGDDSPSSFLYSNFPPFTKRSFISFTSGQISRGSLPFEGYGRFNLTLPVIDNTTTFLSMNLLLPLEIRFPELNYIRQIICLNIPITRDDYFNSLDIFGELEFNIPSTISSSSPSLTSFLDYSWNDGVTPIGVEKIISQFQSLPVVGSLRETKRTFKFLNDDATTSLQVTFRIPQVFVPYSSSFWNLARNTYVQIFYWAWLTYFIWNLFIGGCFKYGLLSCTVRPLLEKNHVD